MASSCSSGEWLRQRPEASARGSRGSGNEASYQHHPIPADRNRIGKRRAVSFPRLAERKKQNREVLRAASIEGSSSKVFVAPRTSQAGNGMRQSFSTGWNVCCQIPGVGDVSQLVHLTARVCAIPSKFRGRGERLHRDRSKEASTGSRHERDQVANAIQSRQMGQGSRLQESACQKGKISPPA